MLLKIAQLVHLIRVARREALPAPVDFQHEVEVHLGQSAVRIKVRVAVHGVLARFARGPVHRLLLAEEEHVAVVRALLLLDQRLTRRQLARELLDGFVAVEEREPPLGRLCAQGGGLLPRGVPLALRGRGGALGLGHPSLLHLLLQCRHVQAAPPLRRGFLCGGQLEAHALVPAVDARRCLLVERTASISGSGHGAGRYSCASSMALPSFTFFRLIAISRKLDDTNTQLVRVRLLPRRLLRVPFSLRFYFHAQSKPR